MLLAAQAACAEKPEAKGQKRAPAAEKSAPPTPAAPAPSATEEKARGPLAARALDGPYASLDAWCEAVKKDTKPPKKCLLDEEGKPALEKPAAPWLAAKTIQSGVFDDRRLRMAVQTAAGWFVSRPSGEPVPIIATSGVKSQDVISGGGAELVVRYVEIGALADGEGEGRWTQQCTERLVVCGMVDNERPGCTAPIAVREGGCRDVSRVEWDWEIDVQLPGDGRARIASKRGALPAGAKALVGTHALGLR